MIKTLEIKNFKSIKHLKLDCKRVNVFIGKPNTGKSNILESVGIFSLPFVNENLKDIVRFENLTNLFNDHDVNEKIEITADDSAFEIKFAEGNYKVSQEDKTKNFKYKIDFDYAGKGSLRESQGHYRALPFKFYQFAVKYNFPDWQADFLQPPRGDNLMQILFTNKNLRKSAADLFGEFGLRIVLKPQEYKIEVQKEVDEVIVAFPYSLASDTLQRVVFHSAAIETNKDSILIFEEPEAHAFPYYTKFLAERIALDNSNQYFIATHNPYFLLSVLEKAPKDDLRIFITYLRNYQTEVRAITEDEMPEILDLDASVFFNLDRFLEEG
jgi:hypothetical protein